MLRRQLEISWLEVNSFVSQEFVVKVVFHLGHVGSNVYFVQKLLGEITTSQAETGFLVSFVNKIGKLRGCNQAVVDGVINLVTYDQVVLAARSGLKSNLIRLCRRRFMFVFAHAFFAELAGFIEALATFVKQQFIFKLRLDLFYKIVLGNLPIFDELYKSDPPVGA